MLTTALTEKLTKNKKVFGSTIDKILEVGILFKSHAFLSISSSVLKIVWSQDEYPFTFQSEKRPNGIPKVLEVAFEVVASPEHLVQEGIYRQNGNMILILGLKLVD